MRSESARGPGHAIGRQGAFANLRSVGKEFDIGDGQAWSGPGKGFNGNGSSIEVGSVNRGAAKKNSAFRGPTPEEGQIECRIRTGDACLVKFDRDEVASGEETGPDGCNDEFEPGCFLGSIYSSSSQSRRRDGSIRHVAPKNLRPV